MNNRGKKERGKTKKQILNYREHKGGSQGAGGGGHGDEDAHL